MIFNHLLSGAAGRGESTKNGDMGSQGVLRLGQKRGNNHLIDNTSASEVITRRRLEADPKFPSRPLPNRPGPSPWGNTSGSTPRFTQMAGFGHGSELGLGGGTNEFPMLNHSAGMLPLPKYLRAAKFAEMDEMTSNTNSDIKRPFDSLGIKAMPPSGYGGYTNEIGFEDSEYSRQQLYPVYTRGLESMRRALGKDSPRSGEDTSQNLVKRFTLNGEPVDKITETASSEGLHEMLPPAPRGLFSSSPYFYGAGSFGSDKVIAPHPNSTHSRGFYRSSFPDLSGNSYILLGRDLINDPTANVHASVGLKIRRHAPGSCSLLSFEASAAMQEAMRNAGKSPAEATTSKSVLKSVTLRKKDRDGSNVFPANVKSLLSTGIFDGVPVKYVSWDRTKNVRGTIQGTVYLCWCSDCKKLKMVNAYQLEQHAGSKSKHPNDHIYFSNGKSIYGVVQELKNTPSDKLLEVIPTVTGSGINNENFSKWKESFQAAGRELQRIFGSDQEPGEISMSRNEVVQADSE